MRNSSDCQRWVSSWWISWNEQQKAINWEILYGIGTITVLLVSNIQVKQIYSLCFSCLIFFKLKLTYWIKWYVWKERVY